MNKQAYNRGRKIRILFKPTVFRLKTVFRSSELAFYKVFWKWMDFDFENSFWEWNQVYLKNYRFPFPFKSRFPLRLYHRNGKRFLNPDSFVRGLLFNFTERSVAHSFTALTLIYGFDTHFWYITVSIQGIQGRVYRVYRVYRVEYTG